MPNSRYAASIADLYGRIGAAQAQGAIGRANAWIPAVQAIPASLGQWAEARDNRKVQAQQAQIREMQIAEAQRNEQRSLADWNDTQQIRALGPLVGNDPAALAREVGVIDPIKAIPFQDRATAQATAQKVAIAEAINKGIAGVLATSPDKQPQGWTFFRNSLRSE